MKALNPHSWVLFLFLGGCHLVISMLNILTLLVTGFYYFLIITLSVFSGLAGSLIAISRRFFQPNYISSYTWVTPLNLAQQLELTYNSVKKVLARKDISCQSGIHFAALIGTWTKTFFSYQNRLPGLSLDSRSNWCKMRIISGGQICSARITLFRQWLFKLKTTPNKGNLHYYIRI